MGLDNIYYLDSDERQYINALATGVPTEEFTRAYAADALAGAGGYGGEDSAEGAALFALGEGLRRKISYMDDDAWRDLCREMPFPTVYGIYDEEDTRGEVA